MILMRKGPAILIGTGNLHLGDMTKWLVYPQSIKGEAIQYSFRNLGFKSPFVVAFMRTKFLCLGYETWR